MSPRHHWGAAVLSNQAVGQILSLLSPEYRNQASWSCLRLLMHLIPWAFCFALLNAGRSIAARIAMMAMRTSSSINVNAGRDERGATIGKFPFAFIGI